MTLKDLINRAGGVAHVADACGIYHGAVGYWLREGRLPSRRGERMSERVDRYVAILAREAGVAEGKVRDIARA